MISVIDAVLINQCSSCNKDTSLLVGAGYFVPLCQDCIDKIITAQNIIDDVRAANRELTKNYESMKSMLKLKF